MPTQVSYPGVYIEELSSGVRTITGVATSIAAFVGWAPKGPTTRALRIFSFSDYERFYGGLHPKSDLGYSVQHFFENGGGEIYVLRLVRDDGTTSGETNVGDIKVSASSPGEWSQFYGVQTKSFGTNRFSLTVYEFGIKAEGGVDTEKYTPVETFVNLSMDKDDSRFVKEIVSDIKRGSLFIKVAVDDGSTDFGASDKPTQIPAGTEVPLDNPNDPAFLKRLGDVADTNKVLDQIDLFNLLCVPGCTHPGTLGNLLSFCRRRRAMLIADCEETATNLNLKEPGINGEARNGAFYFPWVKASDPLAENRLADFPPCGFVAGIMARTDATRGVWKAPAGIDAALAGVHGPKEQMTDQQNGALNVKAVNCIRSFPVYGTVVWGARTLDGDDERGSEWKYIPVRRTALFIEESLYRGTKWAVFEPNDEPLWAQLRLNIGAFMHDLFRQGAFQGRSPREAYFVKCDKETTTQSDINKGIVNVLVGFAPLKPAEFVVIKIQQIAGQLET
jgi:phage tail sheath protein FI